METGEFLRPYRDTPQRHGSGQGKQARIGNRALRPIHSLREEVIHISRPRLHNSAGLLL